MSKLEQKENNVRCVGAGDEGMEWSNAPFIGAQWGFRMPDRTLNQHLAAAQRAKFDEYYTQWPDIEREMPTM